MRFGTTMWSLTVTWPKPSASASLAIASSPSALPVIPRVMRLTPKSIACPFAESSCVGPLAPLPARRSTDQIRHRESGLVPLLSEGVGGAVPVRRGPVLAHLPLADQARDRHLESDDGADLLVDEVGGRIGDLPRIPTPRLVAIRELLDE